MYELRLNNVTKQKFVASAKNKLSERGMTIRDLAKQIGRPVNSLYCFFSNDKKQNKFVAAEIANALEMKREDWS